MILLLRIYFLDFLHAHRRHLHKTFFLHTRNQNWNNFCLLILSMFSPAVQIPRYHTVLGRVTVTNSISRLTLPCTVQWNAIAAIFSYREVNSRWKAGFSPILSGILEEKVALNAAALSHPSQENHSGVADSEVQVNVLLRFFVVGGWVCLNFSLILRALVILCTSIRTKPNSVRLCILDASS